MLVVVVSTVVDVKVIEVASEPACKYVLVVPYKFNSAWLLISRFLSASLKNFHAVLSLFKEIEPAEKKSNFLFLEY